jgi:hypothetical protein
MRSPLLASTTLTLLAALPLLADGPKDNLPDQVRPIPPPGVPIPDPERVVLQEGANALAGWRAGHEVSHEAAPAARKDMTEHKTPYLDEAVVDAATAEEEGGVTGPHVRDLVHCPDIKWKSHGWWKTHDPRCQRQDHTAVLLVTFLSFIAKLALEEGQIASCNMCIHLKVKDIYV